MGNRNKRRGAFDLGLNKLRENYFFTYLWTGAWGKDDDFQRFIGPLFLFFTPFIFGNYKTFGT